MTGFEGFVRADGRVGTRNLVLVMSLIDLANDVVSRIADGVSGAVALLTPAGGLSFGAEAVLIEHLRTRIVANPNVGAVLVVGAAGAALERWPEGVAASGRPAAALCISGQRDSVAAVEAGVAVGRQFLATLSGQARAPVPLSALRIGLRSSSSSLVSADVVNGTVGAVVDAVVGSGGAVAFGETADLAGVAGLFAARGATEEVCAALRIAMQTPVRLSLALGQSAPDPTPTNKAGGIDTLELKGRGALRRLGTGPIHGVLPYGEAMADGLQLMEGPGSAAICLTGLAASGCTLLLYIVGMSSITAAAPLTPAIMVGPPLLADSRDVDFAVTERSAEACRSLLALVCETASGRVSAAETLQGRRVMLPEHLPPF